MVDLIQGSKGGGKGGGGKARVAREAADSLRSNQFAQVVDAVSEGEIEGLVSGLQSVFLDDTPIQNPDGSFNFTGVVLVSRNGTQSQEFLPGFPSVEAETSVASEILYATPVVRSITNANVDAVQVTVGVPQLTSQNMSNGDISGTSVTITLELQSNGGGYAPVKIGQVTTLLSVAGTTASSGANQIVEADLIFNWTGVVNSGGGLFGGGSNGYQTVQWRIDYRVQGAGSWSVLKSGEISGRTSTVYDTATDSYVASAPTAKGSARAENLTEALYEFQIVKVSGTGTLSFVAGGLATTNVVGFNWLGTALQGGAAYISGCTGTRWTGSDVINGKTTSRYQRAYRVPLTGSPPWDIRVSRTTADSTSSALQNKTWWDSYTEIIDSKLTYPNTALQALRIDSSQFSSIPVRGYDLKLLKVKIPSNYNPLTRAYTGVWNGTFTVAWTDNPAWCFYDLVTNKRYGLGDYVDEAQIDKWGLYAIAQYCDELIPDGTGGSEPRFTCNLYLQTREEAYKVLQSMASIFRAMIFWSQGTITTVQDAPSDPVALFTPANVVGGQFSYQGSGARTRHTVALVSWNDPADRYKQKIEYVDDPDGIALYGVQQTEIVAVGCTSRGQAHRIGLWLLYSERMETEAVSFSTGLDGALVLPGEIIQTSDPVRAGLRMGGRLAFPVGVQGAVSTTDKSSLVAVNSNVITKSGATDSWRSARGTAGFSSGRHYWETYITSGGTYPNVIMVGVGLASATLESYPGGDANGRGYYGVSGTKYVSASSASYGVSFTTGDYVGTLLDMDAGTLTFYKNGVTQGTAFTGLTGTFYPMWGIYRDEILTVNLGDTEFRYPAPTIATMSTGEVWTVNRSGSDPFAARVTTDSEKVPCLFLPGITGNYASTPDSAAASVTGDLDIRVKVAMVDWTPPVINTLISKWVMTGGQQSYAINLNPAGTLTFVMSTTGGDTPSFVSTVATGFTDGSTRWVRVTRIQSSGVTTFYTSQDGLAWSQLGATGVVSAGSAIFDSTSVVQVSGYNGASGTQPARGKVYRAQVYNGIDGALAVDLDAARFSSDVVVDSPVTIASGKTYTLWATMPDGTVESRGVTAGVGSTTALSASPAFSDVPAAMSMWVLAANDLVPETWRVVSVAEGTDGATLEINALEYNSSKYAAVEQGLQLTTPPTSALPSGVPEAPTNVIVSESLYRVAGGDVGTRITLSWVGTGSYYEVWWRLTGGNFALVSTVHSTVDIDGVSPGVYEFKIQAKNGVGMKSAPVYVGATILGKTALPSNVTGFQINGLTLSWTEIPDLDAFDYAICRGATWNEPITYYATTQAQIEPLLAGTYTWRIRARDTTGNLSATEATAQATISVPTTPTPTATLTGDQAVLAWNDCTTTYPIDRYEVRYGASWAAGTPEGQVKSLSLTVQPNWTGSRTFWIAGVDTAGNVGTAASVAQVINAPAAPAVSATVVGEELVVTWTVPTSSLPLESYEVRYGASWAAGTSLGTLKGTRLPTLVNWLGARTFWVAATDVRGNVGATTGSIEATVTAPPAPTVTAQVVDNNVLLYWNQVAGTVPTRTYELRKGATWASAEVIGQKSGGFTSVFETASGVFTYWVAAIDTAGNTGTPASAAVTVSQPPDYILKADIDSTFSGTKSKMAQDQDGSYLSPINTTETWQNHFTTRSWASPQAQVDAGYPYFSQPSDSPGYYEETFDYGTALASSRITVTLNTQAVVGAVTKTCKISVSTDNATWTDYNGVWEVYASNFRYVKVRTTFTATAATDFLRVTGLNIRLDSKLKTVTQMVSCNSGDSGGTTVYLTDDGTSGGNKLFLDVDAISITPQGTTAVIPVYDFTDAPDPLSLKILLFNTSGTRVSGTASLTVRGF